jgi:ubiquinone/menaquinone biosynthesis C-methylase UbiE
METSGNRRRWAALAARIARLAIAGPDRSEALITASYDRIAPGYDAAWTGHMRDLTLDLLEVLGPVAGNRCLDLACGTGFVAGELARRGAASVVGVDRSEGMLSAARALHGRSCEFIRADSAEFLEDQPPESLDAITCAWALGYGRPWRTVRAAARALAPGGRLAVIDNTLFSLSGVVWCSILAFAERPEALSHVLRVRFLPGRRSLAALLGLAGLRVIRSRDGSRTFRLPDGRAALDRLLSTGAGAGFEFAVGPPTREDVFDRFARIIERRRGGPDGVRVVHRFASAVAEKP